MNMKCQNKIRHAISPFKNYRKFLGKPFQISNSPDANNEILFTINYSLLTKKAQVILEFTFCMIVVLIMLYGVVKAFHWTGRDVVFRRMSHDQVLTDQSISSRQQIDPYFYTPDNMDAIWDGN